MMVKDAIKYLSNYDENRELVLFQYERKIGEGCFYSLSEGMTPEANSKNLLVMVAGLRIEPIRK